MAFESTATQAGLDASDTDARDEAPTSLADHLPLTDAPRLAQPPSAGATGPLKTGQPFGARYHIIRLLGIGGMGAVYHAWDQELGVSVALKVIRPEATADPDAARDMERRFKRELLLARNVTHKNVVRIHDLGEIDDIKYLTMPYVEGADLATVLRRQGRLPVQRALVIARQIAAGLVAAHEAGVVHRDLKPANIMISTDDQALIMDFGIARSSGPPRQERVTPPDGPCRLSEAPMDPDQTIAPDASLTIAPGDEPSVTGTVRGSVVGTLDYMAPEQARGEPADQRADLYAFGLILRDMLIGLRRVASTGSAVLELMERLEHGVPRLRSVDAGIPESVERLVARCVEVEPAERYQTGADLLADLERLDANGFPLPEPRRFGRRHAAAALVLLLALLAGTWWVARGPTTAVQPDPVSVLIADFDNRTGEPVFGSTLEQALGVSLEGASFITSYPRPAAQRLAAQIKPGSTLDESTARLISVREGIKVILTGSIERSGSQYSVTLKAEDPANGRVLAAATRRASSKDEVLRTVGSLAAKMRTVLGDTTPESGRLAAMETFTAGSLDAARDFSLGQDLASSGRDEEALASYKRALEKDPRFGRAYASWAVSAFKLGRRDEAEEAYKKALSLLDRMTDREKYRTLGAYYLNVARNYDKAIENYTTLVQLYPADRAGHSNLALAYFYLLRFGKALEEGRRAVEIYPRNETFRSNYALYAMYAGDFDRAEAEARKILEQNPSFPKAYLVLATAALARADVPAALDAYGRMARTGSFGASLAATGQADVAMYTGRLSDATHILDARIADDRAAKNTAALAAKYLASGEVAAANGDARRAADAAQQALSVNRDDNIVAAAARLLVRAGRSVQARELADRLGQQLQAGPRAYGKVIEGEIGLEQDHAAEAVAAFREAQKIADIWLARFDLGIAYVRAGHHAEGLAELELAQKRRGEATALFLDDVPSFRYLAPLPYWLARAQAGLGMTAPATRNFTAFLALRPNPSTDPLASDARRRLPQ